MAMRAEAAIFQPAAVTKEPEEAVCPPILPSPWVNPALVWGANCKSSVFGHWEEEVMMLPEMEFELPVPDVPEVPADAFQLDTSEFKLEGLSAFEEALANFLKPSSLLEGCDALSGQSDRSTSQGPGSSRSRSLSPASSQRGSVCCDPPPGLESFAPPGLEPFVPQACDRTSTCPSEEREETPKTKKGWATAPRAALSQTTSGDSQGATTVTLKNLPRKCSRNQLVAKLEEAGFHKKISFVYMPLDLGKKSSNGQAIICMWTEEACEEFTKVFHKASSQVLCSGAPASKRLEVSPAPVQGLENNLLKLRSSAVMMDLLEAMPEWQPLAFDEEGRPIELN